MSDSECNDLHGDDRTRIPHTHVEGVPVSSGIPVQWGEPQDHAACSDAIAAARAVGARDALLSLAAEVEAMVERTQLPDTPDDVFRYGSGILQGIALMARRRAQEGPGTPLGLAPVSQEGQGRPADLSPAGAYMEGVKAERERIRQQIDPEMLDRLAEWFDTDDEFKVTMFPGQWPQRGHEVQDDLRRWAKIIREVPGDG